MIFDSCDPGAAKLAMARSIDGQLVVCGFLTAYEAPALKLGDADRLIVEKPQVYPGVTKQDPNDLISVALAAGWLTAQYQCKPWFVTPRAWKGQLPKPPHHLAVWQALTPAERVAMAKCIGQTPLFILNKIDEACTRLALTGKVTGYAWEAHNLLDAIGLNLFATGRLGVSGSATNPQRSVDLNPAGLARAAR